MSDKPTYRYWVHPRKEGDTEVQGVTVYTPEGPLMGMTQVWKGVTAEEMVKDYVEVCTEHIWPEFGIQEFPEPFPSKVQLALIRVMAYMEEDEKKDYDQQVKEQGEHSQRNHIWHEVKTLQDWMEGK